AYLEAAAGEAPGGLERLVAVGDAGEEHELALPRALLERLDEQRRRLGLDHDLALEVGAGAERQVLVRRPRVAVRAGVVAAAVGGHAPAEAEAGRGVVGEDRARAVLVPLELRLGDLVEPLDLRRGPGVLRVGNRNRRRVCHRSSQSSADRSKAPAFGGRGRPHAPIDTTE